MSKKSYWKNPEKYRETQRNWYKNKYQTDLNFRKKEQLRINKWRRISPKGRYGTLVKNSKKRNMPIIISQNEFVDWYKNEDAKCFYCNKPNKKECLEIERLDNNQPYKLDNIKFACHDCNSVKGNVLSKEEMQLVGKLVMEKRWKKKT